MRSVRVLTADGRPVCDRCLLAGSFAARARGLLGRPGLGAGEGMLIRPAGSVHTLFMRFPIDAVFLDRELQVVGIASSLPPWRLAGRRRARATLELAAGEAARHGLEPGTQLRLAEP